MARPSASAGNLNSRSTYTKWDDQIVTRYHNDAKRRRPVLCLFAFGFYAPFARLTIRDSISNMHISPNKAVELITAILIEIMGR